MKKKNEVKNHSGINCCEKKDKNNQKLFNERGNDENDNGNKINDNNDCFKKKRNV